MLAVCQRVQAAAKIDRRNCDTVLAVVDAAAVGEDVDVCAFGAEFAVALQMKHFVSGLSVVLGGTSIGSFGGPMVCK